jgi:hypothetical protein
VKQWIIALQKYMQFTLTVFRYTIKEPIRMVQAFKDYPIYEDVQVDEKWAAWARNVFLANAAI